ncbi:hypothetical protein IOD14_43125 [Streptomyces sp. A2-16]|uniref:hypothetical protein n=1 Tax=Streptomyces sp. A2-16 TaxID=2781734 RepID=UPI001BAF55E9|nr:hypothetical protein [Streptomyces sp. A2-16]QUC63005.1 hypothetical protein IOD14_43125 [Streptomyces sp. A2-16]
MTGEFASAMVTVIPVVLLVATVEFNEIEKRADETEQRAIEAARGEGLSDRQAMQSVSASPLLRGLRNLQTVWYAALTLHIFAEAYLIFWLADDARPADVFFAWFVSVTGCSGFVMLLAAVVAAKKIKNRKVRGPSGRNRSDSTPAG